MRAGHKPKKIPAATFKSNAAAPESKETSVLQSDLLILDEYRSCTMPYERSWMPGKALRLA
jgi:hypothetical protein